MIDIVILLCGAFSRYVNQLEDEDFQTQKKEIISVLRALRVNVSVFDGELKMHSGGCSVFD